MSLFIQANIDQEREIRTLVSPPGADLQFSRELPGRQEINKADGFLLLDSPTAELDFSEFNSKPVIVNEVLDTLEEMNAPENVSRINGWPGFLRRELWEIATHDEKGLMDFLSVCNRKLVFVKDIPGFVAARTVSMIVNEAYFALREEVSTREEIDMAMKLGTNYPQGPFEWANRIGLQNIYDLLSRLARTNSLYQPSFPKPTVP